MKRCAALLGVVAAAGCGGSTAPSGPTVRVAAASSLEPVLKSCVAGIAGAHVRLELGTSKGLAAEIRHGVLPDVFLASNMGLPLALAREQRVAKPIAFATNQLVIAVPAGDRSIQGLSDLTRPSASIAMGTVSSSLGMYTRAILARLATDQRIAVLSHVQVQEPDGTRLVSRLVSQAAQAGFVFASDVRASAGRLRAVALPPELGATLVYGGATVAHSPQPQAASRVMADVLHGGCAGALRGAGFGAPPR